MPNKTTKEKKMSYAEFARLAIEQMRDTEKSMGINTVYSDFNEAMKLYYGEEELNKVKFSKKLSNGKTYNWTGTSAIIQKLIDEGEIQGRPVAKGVQIFLPGELRTRASSEAKGASALEKMGIKLK